MHVCLISRILRVERTPYFMNTCHSDCAPIRSRRERRMTPQIIFGTATFGMELTEFQDAESIDSLLQTLSGLGIHRLDSAARYPPMNPGRSEELIGESGAYSKEFIIDTKIYTNTQTNGSGDLARSAVRASVEGSLRRLQMEGAVRIPA